MSERGHGDRERDRQREEDRDVTPKERLTIQRQTERLRMHTKIAMEPKKGREGEKQRGKETKRQAGKKDRLRQREEGGRRRERESGSGRDGNRDTSRHTGLGDPGRSVISPRLCIYQGPRKPPKETGKAAKGEEAQRSVGQAWEDGRRPGPISWAPLLSQKLRVAGRAGLKVRLGGRALWGHGRAPVLPRPLQDLKLPPQEPQEKGAQTREGQVAPRNRVTQ